MVENLLAGWTYETWFPFKREKYLPIPEPEDRQRSDGSYVQSPERDTWVPGWRIDPHSEEEDWDGEGALLLRVVSLHRPGPTYPERAFYVRQWRDPDGRTFGRDNLRVITASALRRWLAGSKTAHFTTYGDRKRALERSALLFAEAMAAARPAESGAGVSRMTRQGNPAPADPIQPPTEPSNTPSSTEGHEQG